MTVWLRLAVPPAVEVAVSVIVYVPAAAYVCDGFRAVDVAPSPKYQLQVAAFLVRLAHVTVSPLGVQVNAIVGGTGVGVGVGVGGGVAVGLGVGVGAGVGVGVGRGVGVGVGRGVPVGRGVGVGVGRGVTPGAGVGVGFARAVGAAVGMALDEAALGDGVGGSVAVPGAVSGGVVPGVGSLVSTGGAATGDPSADVAAGDTTATAAPGVPVAPATSPSGASRSDIANTSPPMASTAASAPMIRELGSGPVRAGSVPAARASRNPRRRRP